jgi:RNase P subunit RPR2
MDTNKEKHTWTDGKTLDITIKTKLSEYITNNKCESETCDTELLFKNDNLLTLITDKVKATHIQCKKCGQKHFIKEELNIPIILR